MLEMTIGQEVANIKPYTTNKKQPVELISRRVFMFFIKNEIITIKDAK